MSLRRRISVLLLTAKAGFRPPEAPAKKPTSIQVRPSIHFESDVVLDICSPVEKELNTLLEKLPIELLLDIIEACSFSTLAIVAQTCRYLHSVVTPILYRDIHVVYSHRSTLLLRTLVESPHLAKYVRSYCRAGAVSSCPCANAFAKELGHTVPGLQFRALHNASNLTSLEIRVALNSPYFDEAKSRVSFLLDGTVQLSRLAIHPVSEEIAGTSLWSGIIHEVLKAQPLLEELALPNKKTWQSPEYALEHDALPKLTSLLTGAKGTFEALLKERPGITSLGFHQMTMKKIIDDVLPLVSDPKLITEVTWRAMGENPDLLPFAMAFPSLQALRLRYATSAFDLFMTQALPAVLQETPHLQELDLGGCSGYFRHNGETEQVPFFRQWSDTPKEVATSDDRCRAALRCFEAQCSTLLKVTFHDYTPWYRNQAGDPWEKLVSRSCASAFTKDFPFDPNQNCIAFPNHYSSILHDS